MRLAQSILTLDALASAPESACVPLVSPVYSASLNPINVDRIDKIKSWILKKSRVYDPAGRCGQRGADECEVVFPLL